MKVRLQILFHICRFIIPDYNSEKLKTGQQQSEIWQYLGTQGTFWSQVFVKNYKNIYENIYESMTAVTDNCSRVFFAGGTTRSHRLRCSFTRCQPGKLPVLTQMSIAAAKLHGCHIAANNCMAARLCTVNQWIRPNVPINTSIQSLVFPVIHSYSYQVQPNQNNQNN